MVDELKTIIFFITLFLFIIGVFFVMILNMDEVTIFDSVCTHKDKLNGSIILENNITYCLLNNGTKINMEEFLSGIEYFT